MTRWEKKLLFLLERENSEILNDFYTRISNAVRDNDLDELISMRKELWEHEIPVEIANLFRRLMNTHEGYSSIINIDNRLEIFLNQYKSNSNMSFRDIADSSDINPSYIYKLFNGEKSNPSLPIIASIAEVFGVNILDVLKFLLGEDYYYHLRKVKSKTSNDVLSEIDEICNEALRDSNFLTIIKTIKEIPWQKDTKDGDLLKVAVYIDNYKNGRRKSS